jgi:ubiquitin-like protein Pup
MTEQVQKTKSKTGSKEEIQEIPKAKDSEALKKELDDLLDEIDGVLATNAQEFVSSYIQKGGQ